MARSQPSLVVVVSVPQGYQPNLYETPAVFILSNPCSEINGISWSSAVLFNRIYRLSACYPFCHPNRLAPPVSIASISALVHGVLWNRGGSSLRSKNSPFLGWMEPSSAPEWPPIAP